MGKYILSIDQSTQGTKAMILDGNGNFLLRRDITHRQIINDRGWVGHDASEIAENIFKVCRLTIDDSGIKPEDIVAVAVTNQRETVAAWDRKTGKPVCESIVWQCNRAASVCNEIDSPETRETVYRKTGLRFSPFFSAPKIRWILRNIPGAKEKADNGELCLGTMDTWTIWQLTGGEVHRTDTSNASRTMLFNINTLCWDDDLLKLFGIPVSCLPEVCPCDSVFGYTDLGGLLPKKVPVHSALGDSHGVMFSHGCTEKGSVMCGYGTGSAVLMNIGTEPVYSDNGVNTTIAWTREGKTMYALEGVVNYSGAVVTWLQKNANLVEKASQTSAMAYEANPADTTYMVPAFTGIGAPHWKSDATAAYVGMTRITGRNELVKAALESVAYQIADLVYAFERESSSKPAEFRVAGGPANNDYMMQFQSNILGCPVVIPEHEELSGIGSAYVAGIAEGLYDYETLLKNQKTRFYNCLMDESERNRKLNGWKHALDVVLKY